jgi:hypothetical protein
MSSEDFASLPALVLDMGEPLCGTAEGAPGCEIGPNGELVSDGGTHLISYDLGAGALARIVGRPGVVKTLGRSGAGPGEYRTIFAAGIGEQGDVAVFDPAQRKVLRFGSDGGTAEIGAIAFPAGFLAAGFFGIDLWAVAGDIEGDHATGDSVHILLYQLGERNGFRRVGALPLKQPGRGMEDMRPVPAIFAAQELWHFSRDGRILHSSGEALVVDVYDSTGHHTLRIGAAVPPRGVTEAEFQREFEARTSRAPPGPMGKAMREQAARRVPYHAGITALRQLENGQIWVREAPAEAGDSVGWVVFTSEGTPVGRLRLPADVRILAATDSGLVVIPATGNRPPVPTWATLKSAP